MSARRSFDPDNATVLSVFEKHLSVPMYQRPYTWKPENIGTLWDDIWTQDNGNFLGIIVLHDNNKRDEEGTRRIEIIDGQQRLTTLTILFSLIRNLASSLGDEALAAETHMAIERSNAAGSQGFVLSVSKSLKEFMIENLQSKESRHEELMSISYSELSNEAERVVRNYRKAYDLITSSEEWSDDSSSKIAHLKDLKLRLLDSESIQVTVNSEDDAYDLFETLNARSVSLSEVNMIKNRIFMSLSGSMSDTELERRWVLIEEHSGGERRKPEDIQKFINYFWWSRYAKIPPRQIFRSLKSENLEYMLEQIESDSIVYGKLKSRDSSHLIQYRHIDLTSICTLANILNLQQVYIPLLSLARKFSLPEDKYWNEFSNRNMVPFIDKLEKFIFTYKFSPRSPAAIEKIYSDGAKDIFKSTNRTELVNALLRFEEKLNENFPTEDEFKQKFSELSYKIGAGSNNKIISYALSKIYFGDSKELIVNEADIEHIFPKNPIKGFRKDEFEIENQVNSLGNLTLLAEEINRTQCQNKRPLDKTIYYRESNIPQNTDLANDIDSQKYWSSDNILNRKMILIDDMWNYLKP